MTTTERQKRSVTWSFSKEGRTFAYELKTWWKAQPEAERDQYMRDETMDDNIVHSFWQCYHRMSRDDLVADYHEGTLTTAKD
jgi:hypothetical protein